MHVHVLSLGMTSSPASAPRWDARLWGALILLCGVLFLDGLDVSMVGVALPSIQADLGLTTSQLQWVISAYVLGLGGVLLLGGRAADLLGRRRVFMFGLVVFGLASLAGGLANSEGMLIAARAVQGLGAAILSPAALSIVTTTFEEGSERNRALGIWGAVAGSGGAAGVLLGGVLTDSLGWEWVFFVNTPIALAAAFIAPRLIDESSADARIRHFDAAGAITVTAGLSLLVYAMVDATNAGWGSTQTIVLLAVSVALLVSFVVIELRSRAPLVPFRVFRLPNIAGANVSGLLIGASLFSMFFFISLYMQQVLGYSPLKSGLSYLPLAFTIIISAGVASQLVSRFGFKPILISGMAFIAIGLLMFSRVPVDGSYAADVLPASIVAAIGLGFSFVPVTIAATAGVQGREAGLASGLVNTFRQVGGSIGLALLATVATQRTDAVAGSVSHAAALTAGFERAFLVGAVFGAIGALISLTVLARGQAARVAAAARAQGA
jgi:EmrB/QacA subfamily drug resistance transporter